MKLDFVQILSGPEIDTAPRGIGPSSLDLDLFFEKSNRKTSLFGVQGAKTLQILG